MYLFSLEQCFYCCILDFLSCLAVFFFVFFFFCSCFFCFFFFFFFSSRRRHTRWPRDWSSDVCSSDLAYIFGLGAARFRTGRGSTRDCVRGRRVVSRIGHYAGKRSRGLPDRQAMEVILDRKSVV